MKCATRVQFTVALFRDGTKPTSEKPGGGVDECFFLAGRSPDAKGGIAPRLFLLASACHSLGRNRRIIRGKFDSDARSARIPCRFSRASAADEGVQHRPAFRDHFHKFHAGAQRACSSGGSFSCGPPYARTARAGTGAAVAQPSPCWRRSQTRPPCGTPRAAAARVRLCQTTTPRHVQRRRLYSVSHGGKLPPVRKNMSRGRSVPGHAPALGKPTA